MRPLMHRSGLCGLVSLALVLGLAQEASAFFPLGAFNAQQQIRLQTWHFSDFDTNNDGDVTNDEGVPILIENGRSGFTDAEVELVRDAFEVWGDVPTSYAAARVEGFIDDPVPSGVTTDYLNIIAMWVSEAAGDGEDIIPDPADVAVPGLAFPVLGLTVFDFVIENELRTVNGVQVPITGGTLVDCDIVIDAESHRPADDGTQPVADLFGTLVHEVGHFFGLGHPPLSNLRPLLQDPTDPTTEIGYVENAPFWMVFPDGTADFIGVTPTMYPIVFETDIGGVRREGAWDLAPDDISGLSWLHPRGNQLNFFSVAGSARTQVRSGIGVPSTPISGGHVVAWADIDNTAGTSRIPLFSTMADLYLPIPFGQFTMYNLWKRTAVPGSTSSLFNLTYTFTHSPLNQSGFERQAPIGLTPDAVDSITGGLNLFTPSFISEVFHESENVNGVLNHDAGTPLVWDFDRQQFVSATTGRSLGSILANRPMFGDRNDVCPLNLLIPGTDTGGDTGGIGLSLGGSDKLRGLRDRVLLDSAVGSAVVDFYYQMAPSVTRYLIEHTRAQSVARAGVIILFWSLEHIRMILVTLLLSVMFFLWWVGRRRRRVVSAALLLAVMFFLPTLADARIAYIKTPELAAGASDIVSGKVVAVESRRPGNVGHIYTDVTLEVDLTAKGSFEKQVRITFTVLGGRSGNTVMTVSEMPTFEVGEEVVIYLRHQGQFGLVVHGGLRGKFSVTTDETTGQKFVVGSTVETAQALSEDKSAIDKAAGQTAEADADSDSEDEVATLPLEDYIEYLRELVAEQETAEGAGAER